MSNENSDINEYQMARGIYIPDPWERVKFIFKKNNYGELHPDLAVALNLAQVGLIAGISFGGFIHHKKYIREYKERSDANMYHSHSDAGRQMAREAFRGYLEGAWKWGPRMAIFIGGFSLFTSCVEAYRNKHGIAEYSVGGSVIGGLLKFNFGIRGMLVGSLVGMILGTFYGVTYVSINKLTNQDTVIVKYGQYAFSKYMNELSRPKKMEKENIKLDLGTQSHLNKLNPLDNSELEDDKVDENLK